MTNAESASSAASGQLQQRVQLLEGEREVVFGEVRQKLHEGGARLRALEQEMARQVRTSIYFAGWAIAIIYHQQPAQCL